jgi:hypothetical protein
VIFSELTVTRLNKNVQVWSSRKNRNVTVNVDYQRIKAGKFTLIHIARLRDSFGYDTSAHLPQTGLEIELIG